MNEYGRYTPKDFIILIDEKFAEFAGKINRIDIKWGLWSREMNLEIRRRTEMGDSDALILGLVFAYWMTMSQLMDLVYKCKGLRRFLLEKKIKNKASEAQVIREKVYEGS